jgi:hypothetical protein
MEENPKDEDLDLRGNRLLENHCMIGKNQYGYDVENQ